MADVNANIGINIDTSQSLAEIKALQRQLAQLYTSINKGSAAAAAAQKGLATNLMNTVNAGGKFYAQMGTIRTSTESFTHALEKNKLTMREYFRYAGGSTRTFGKLFKQEFDTIGRVAEERVKKMQTQYIKLGRDASGAMKAISITPTTLNMKDYGTQVAVAAQKQALLNQLLKQGSTNLLNFGKNTQWAGRQLMVGFTIPLAYFGTAAAKTFMDLETQALKFRRVYGSMFTTTAETEKALSDIQNLAKEFTKYGVAVSQTMEMAASAAAMGKTGAELTAQVAQATRLAVLGNVEQQQALDTTISLTNAFGLAAEDLTSKINFLNAVENQTVTAIEDLTIAIPKAGPVIQQLGGSVEDLAFFLTAMREGGINASEGANALKSGLASLINPTDKAAKMLAGMGININAIVEGNAGNLREIVIDFAQALDTLAPLERSRAIEQLFGKFQFARLSTLFQNVTKDGTQASRVLQLASASVEELAILSERELKAVEDAVGTNFKAAVEELKLAIAPIGKEFLKAITPVVKFFGDLFEKFNNLSDGSKKFIVVLTTLIGLVGPTLLMTFGLLANGAANIIKLFLLMRQGFLKLTGNSTNLAQQTQYLNSEQMEAAVVAASLNQAHTKLTQQFVLEANAVNQLRTAYINATAAATRFAAANPGMMLPGFKGIKGGKTGKFARGTTGVTGGQPGKDSVPSLLMPGEAVIPTDIAQDDRFKPLVQALVSGEIQQFGEGTDEVTKTKRKAIKQRFRKIYGKDSLTRQSYIKNAANLDKLVDRLTYDPQTKTYSLTTKQGKVLTGITEAKLFEKANYVFGKVPSQKGDFISEKKFGTPSNLERQLERVSKDGVRGTGAPTALLRLRDKANIQFAGKGIDREVATLSEKLKSAGYSAKDIKNFTQSHLSHIMGGGDTATKWTRGQVLSDFQGLNQYIKGAGGPEVLRQIKDPRVMLPTSQGGLGMSPRQVQLLLRDWAWAGNQKHPTSDTDFRRYARIAAFQEAASKAGMNVKNIGLVKGINALAAVRDPAFYKDVNERIIQLGDKARVGVSKAEIEKLTKDIKRGAVLKAREEFKVLANRNESIQNVTTGKVRPVTGTRVDTSQITTPTGNKRDNILTTLKRGERIIQGVAAARTGRRLVLPGAQDAPVLSQAQVRAAQEGISLKEAKRREAADRRATIAAEKQAEQTDKTTKQTKTLGQKFSTGANVFSGLTIMGSFMGGKIGEVSQKLAPLAIGLSTITMLMPGLKSGLLKFGTLLATNPFAPLILAATVAVVGLKIIDEKNKKQAKAQSEYIDAISATTEKMKAVGQITGKVGASEIMARRREGATANKFTTGYDRAGQQFGTSFLESDVGKQIYETFSSNVVKAGSQSVKQIALELSSYVSDGLMTADDANSVARSIGIKMSDMAIAANIQGELRSILGPNGEKLETEPLKVRLEIIKEQKNIFSDVADQLKQAYAESPSLATAEQKTLAAQVGAAGAQSLEVIQAQRDAQSKLYDDQIRTLEAQLATTKDKKKQEEIESQILTLKDKQGRDDAKLAQERSKLIKDQQDAYKTIKNAERFSFDKPGEVAMFRGLQEQVRTKFKDNPLVETFISKAKDTSSKELELTITTMVGSGDLTPQAGIKLIDLFGEEKEAELEAVINSKVSLQNPDKFAQLTSLATGLTGKGSKKVGLDIITAFTAEGEEGKLDDRLAALTLLQNMDGKEIDVAAFLKGDAVGKIDKLVPLLNKVEKQKKIDITVLQKLQKDKDMPSLQGLIDDWERYKNLDPEIQKTVTQTYISVYKTITDENAGEMAKEEAAKRGLRGRSAAAFVSQYGNKDSLAALLTREQFPEGKAKNTIPTGDGKDTGGKDRDTTLDNLLNRLKFVRKASIDAAGGVNELMRITGGKGITNFGGVMQQLMAGPKGGFNREFISFLEGMDNATRKTYMTVKDGQVILTKQGKALKEAFNEKVIGDYQVAQVQAKQDTFAQAAALAKLQAAGVDTSTALEMVADANLAVAINSQDISSQELVNMANNAKDAKAAIDALNLALKQESDESSKRLADSKIVLGVLNKVREIQPNISQDIMDYISSNTDFAKELAKAFEGASGNVQELQNIINNIPAQKKIDIEIAIAKNPVAEIERQIGEIGSKMSAYFASKRDVISQPFLTQMQPFEDIITDLGPQIAQAEIDLNKAQKALNVFENQIAGIESEISAKRLQLEVGIEQSIKAQTAAIEKIRKQIEDQFEKPIAALQETIKGLERNIEIQFDRPVEALQEQSSDLANDLTLMDRIVDSINKKYDLQEQALQKVADANQEILNQQKSQLDIADALTQGDIAAAARAVQDARSQAASAAAQRAGGTLAAAREAEIAGLRSASGMTRAQIEERQFQISQQIFALEEQREAKQLEIRNIQDQIYNIEIARDKFIKETLIPAEEALVKLENDRLLKLEEIEKLELDILKIKTSPEYKKAIADVESAQSRLDKLNQQLRDAQLEKAKIEAELEKALKEVEKQEKDWAAVEAAINNAKLATFNYGEELKKAQGLADKLAKAISGAISADQGFTVPGTGDVDTGNVNTGNIPGSQDPEFDETGFKAKIFAGRVSNTATGAATGTKTSVTKQIGDSLKIAATSAPIVEKAIANIAKSTDSAAKNQQIITDSLVKQSEQLPIHMEIIPKITELVKDYAKYAKQIMDDVITTTKDYIKQNPIIEKIKTVLETTVTIYDQIKSKLSEVLDRVSAYISGLEKALSVAQSILSTIMSLNRTVVTTHIIRTIYEGGGGGGGSTDGPTGPNGPTGPTNPVVPPGAFTGPFMYGGIVPKYLANGGKIGSDTVPAMLTPGEFVVNKTATDAFLPLLSLLNNTKYPSMLANRFSTPSFDNTSSVGSLRDLTAPVFFAPSNNMISSTPLSTSTSVSNVDNSSMVYNYNIDIAVNGSGNNPSNIAKTVIDQIKYVDSQRVRTQRAV